MKCQDSQSPRLSVSGKRSPPAAGSGRRDCGTTSSDRGKTWGMLQLGDAWRPVSRIAVAPGYPDLIYAGTHPNPDPDNLQPAAVLRSTDGGLTWSVISPSIPEAEGDVQTLAAVSDQEVWFGTGGGLASGQRGRLYHTTDGGQTWTAMGLGTTYPEQPRTIAIAPADPRTVYVGWQNPLNRGFGSERYFIKSTDGGQTWSNLWLPNTDTHVGVVAVSPHDSKLVVAGTDGQLMISTDAGATWRQTDFAPYQFLRPFDHHSLAFDAVDPDTFATMKEEQP
ncbi:MAG TPA: exo-alpha-sialidase [Anaerolineae bacterium]|nr:exo-alpha-sialidase [Anaerolineae bacterium]